MYVADLQHLCTCAHHFNVCKSITKGSCTVYTGLYGLVTWEVHHMLSSSGTIVQKLSRLHAHQCKQTVQKNLWLLTSLQNAHHSLTHIHLCWEMVCFNNMEAVGSVGW